MQTRFISRPAGMLCFPAFYAGAKQGYLEIYLPRYSKFLFKIGLDNWQTIIIGSSLKRNLLYTHALNCSDREKGKNNETIKNGSSFKELVRQLLVQHRSRTQIVDIHTKSRFAHKLQISTFGIFNSSFDFFCKVDQLWLKDQPFHLPALENAKSVPILAFWHIWHFQIKFWKCFAKLINFD